MLKTYASPIALLRTLLLSFCVLLTVVLLQPQSAQAKTQIAFHAKYARSSPAMNERLPAGKPPVSVQVWFSERIEPGFTRLEVYDKSRQRVDLNDTFAAPNNEFSVLVTMKPNLPDGAYTVVYRNVSRDDGHSEVGNFSFVVGGAELPKNTSELLSQLQTGDNNFNVWSVTIRWLNFLAMATFVGLVTFLLTVWQPSSKKIQKLVGAELTQVRREMWKRTSQVMLWSLFGLLVGWGGFAVYQASFASASAPWEIFGNQALSNLLLQSKFGYVLLARLGLIVLGFGCWFMIRNALTRKRYHLAYQLAPIALIIGLGIIVTTSLNSHAAAKTKYWFMLPTDILHLIGTSFWIGGLIALAIIVPLAFQQFKPGTGDRTRAWAILIPAFTFIALISVAILVVTGTIAALLQMGTWEAFVQTGYGLSLLAKLIIFLALLGLGAFHLLRISPRMRTFAASTDEETGASSLAAGSLQRLFQKSVRIEAAIAVGLLLSVGVLTSMSPPPPPVKATTAGPLVKQGTMADVTYNLVVNPTKPGPNQFEMVLQDQNGQAVTKTDLVAIRFIMLDMDMGLQETVLEPVAGKPGQYSANATSLSMAGEWELTLLVRRAGMDDAQTTFRFTMGY